MCGIAGLSLVAENKSLIKRFLKIKKSLFHRGPDGSGVYKKKNINLIHTRLSIVDLKQGHQPIKNKNLILVANGEIYNDLEIREKYSNYRFKTKWIFRKAMEGHLPHDIIYRKKTGFGAPVRIWIKNEFRELIRDLLSHESVQKRGIFDSKKIQKILQDNESGKIEASYTIMALLGLEIWFRNFINT